MKSLSGSASDAAGYPAIPKPNHPDLFPSQTSAFLVMSSMEIEIWLYVWGSKGEDRGAFIPLKLGTPKFGSTNPPFPNPCKLEYRRYWKNIGSYKIAGPQTFETEVTVTEGMFDPDFITLGCHTGNDISDLPGRLSAATGGMCIPIELEKYVTKIYRLFVDDNKIAVYTLWQLVQEFVLTDRDGKPIVWHGTMPVGSPTQFPTKLLKNTFTHNTQRYVADPVIFSVS